MLNITNVEKKNLLINKVDKNRTCNILCVKQTF